jgi:UDP-2,3-diacylglucosamine hydrolase
LYILGDLFEAWIGDDAVGKHERSVARWLRETSDAGTPVYFLHGNRDFLIGRDFCAQAGMRLLEQPFTLDLYGTATVLLHGDTLCTLDAAYQRYRRRVTDPDWQARMLSRPVWMRRALARALRLASRLSQRDPDREELDVSPDAAEALFSTAGAVRMIHGHTHKPDRHQHRISDARCERIVLGDWYTQGSVLTVTPAEARLERLPR